MPDVSKINGYKIDINEEEQHVELKNVYVAYDIIYKGTNNSIPGKKYLHCIRLFKINTLAIVLQIYSSSNTYITMVSELKSFLDSFFGSLTTGYTEYLQASGTIYASDSVGWRPICMAAYNNRSGNLIIQYSNSRTSYTTASKTFTLSTSGILISDAVTPL